MAMDLKVNKGKVNEIRKNITENKQKLDDFKAKKENLIDARMSIEGSGMEQDAKKAAIDALNQAVKENQEAAKETSQEMQSDTSALADLKEEADDAITDTQKQIQKLETTKNALDKVGAGHLLDAGLNTANESLTELNEHTQELIEAEKELSDIRAGLNNI